MLKNCLQKIIFSTTLPMVLEETHSSVLSNTWLRQMKTTVENIRAFEDGDKVFLQTVYNFAGAGEQVAFDILDLTTKEKSLSTGITLLQRLSRIHQDIHRLTELWK